MPRSGQNCAEGELGNPVRNGPNLSEENPAIERVRCRILPDGRVTRRDAAAYLGNKEKTLAMWQLQGRGPPSVKVGGRRYYFLADLDDFIANRSA